eukprot:6190624-Pleurochrysis_carterae.AAC.2
MTSSTKCTACSRDAHLPIQAIQNIRSCRVEEATLEAALPRSRRDAAAGACRGRTTSSSACAEIRQDVFCSARGRSVCKRTIRATRSRLACARTPCVDAGAEDAEQRRKLQQ